jgi:hypothetical protein
VGRGETNAINSGLFQTPEKPPPRFVAGCIRHFALERSGCRSLNGEGLSLLLMCSEGGFFFSPLQSRERGIVVPECERTDIAVPVFFSPLGTVDDGDVVVVDTDDDDDYAGAAASRNKYSADSVPSI